MFRRVFQDPSKGCAFLLFEITSFAANAITVIEWIENFIGQPRGSFLFPFFKWDDSPFLSGIILFYGLTGISVFVWCFLADRVIGSFSGWIYSFILYMLFSALVIYSYANSFFSATLVEFFVSKTAIFFFVILPFLLGRVGMEICMAPVRPED
jgi:hypothetical protein